MRISDWSSDVCSSDLENACGSSPSRLITKKMRVWPNIIIRMTDGSARPAARPIRLPTCVQPISRIDQASAKSEEHTSELQSLMRISYAVFCLKKQKIDMTRNKLNT